MTDLTSTKSADFDWQDDDTSMYETDRLNHDMAFMSCLGAGLLAVFPLAFCVYAARHLGWL